MSEIKRVCEEEKLGLQKLLGQVPFPFLGSSDGLGLLRAASGSLGLLRAASGGLGNLAAISPRGLKPSRPRALAALGAPSGFAAWRLVASRPSGLAPHGLGAWRLVALRPHGLAPGGLTAWPLVAWRPDASAASAAIGIGALSPSAAIGFRASAAFGLGVSVASAACVASRLWRPRGFCGLGDLRP